MVTRKRDGNKRPAPFCNESLVPVGHSSIVSFSWILIRTMAEIDIPFNDWSTERHEQGKKTATTRTNKYGDPGDRFTTAGNTYELTHIVKVPLDLVEFYFYEQEGADSKEEFVDVWEDIHYKRGFEPDWDVWLHLYREVGENYE